MNPTRTRALRTSLGAALAGATLLAAPAAFADPGGQPGGPHRGGDWNQEAFRGDVEVVPGDDASATTLSGVVFDDADRDSTQDAGERGIEGVSVSNGRDVVTTDAEGRYELTVEPGMDVFVTQPRGYQVPVDEDNVAQFSYTHLPEGSPDLKYGGIEPTGALPEAVNFPLASSKAAEHPLQNCIIGGDIQPYTASEVGYAAAGAFTDLAAREDYTSCGALFIGDVVGDDLSLYSGVRDQTARLNGPARFLPGNHDLDFDAATREHSVDTYRSEFGAQYYSYDVGKLHVVALNSIEYPVGDSYNGSLGEEQLEWLRRDIAQTPQDRTVVVASHIPLLDYADQDSAKHQVDEVAEIHDILSGREAIALGGHSHSIENLRAGDSLAGWQETFGIDELPFTHLTAGAISGDWYSGELLDAGYPAAIQRDGGVPGVVTLEARGGQITEHFTQRGDDGSNQMNIGLNTPSYRDWFDTYSDSAGEAPALETAGTVAQSDLGETWLSTNFWMGGSGSEVQVSIDGGPVRSAERTQAMDGEGQHVGAEWSDPEAVQQQLVDGGNVADRSMHLWRLPMPEGLAVGAHTAEVTAVGVDGQATTETFEFEVTE